MQRSSRSVSSSPAPETSSPCTPRSTGFRRISAWPCPMVFRPSWPPSPPSVPSPCRACVKAVSRSATRPASSASAWWGSWSSSSWWPPVSRWSGSIPTRTAAGWPRRRARWSAQHPTTMALADGGEGALQGVGGFRCRPGVPGRGGLIQPAGRAGGTPRTRPGNGRGHRQVQAGPPLERLLREGARPSVFALVRARPL